VITAEWVEMEAMGREHLQIRSWLRSGRIILLVENRFPSSWLCRSLVDASTIHSAVPGVSLAINGYREAIGTRD
jgi:hypothetical protein